MRFAPLLSLLVLSACAVDGEVVTDEAELPDGDDGKADGASELTVRAGETSVWVDKVITRDTRDGAEGVVLHGRASRNLTGGFAFVLDDPYGQYDVRSARTFEVRWTTSELTTLLVGVNQFINLQFVHSSSRPDALTARVVARGRMGEFSGTGSYLFADVVPVTYGNRTYWRVTGSATTNILEVVAEVGPDRIANVRITDPRHFTIDLPIDRAIDMVGSSKELAVSVQTASGTRIKRGKLGLVVKKLGLTTGDAYEVWPRVECEDDVLACLATQPADTCGEALEVNACAGQTGVISVTDADVQIARAAADPQLVTLRADAPALVGAARADALLSGATYLVVERLDALVGTVFPSTADRDAALAAAAAGAIDDAYAFPLAHVPALTPLPDDPIRARDIAADALLTYLSTADLTTTEFGRSVHALVHEYRAQHLASLAALRAATPEDLAGWPPYLFLGNWLGAHVEISVAQATGVATNVLFEID